MSGLRKLAGCGAVAFAVVLSGAAAQERTSPVRPERPQRPEPPSQQMPSGSYQRTCRGANLNGAMLSAQCTGPTGAPIYSSIDTNGCRGRDIYNDRGYLRCDGSGGGPRPPEPPRPPRPEPPRPIPPGPGYGRFEVIVYTSSNFQGTQMRIDEPIANFANWRGFNDNIRSIRVVRGRAEICVDRRYEGRCVTISESYRDLNRIGMGNRISSIR